MTRRRCFATLIRTIVPAVLFLVPQMLLPATQSADFEFFRKRVEPVFLKYRPNHARCATCHAGGSGGAFVLQVLAPGTTKWTEEQSMRNYLIASELVAPGNTT